MSLPPNKTLVSYRDGSGHKPLPILHPPSCPVGSELKQAIEAGHASWRVQTGADPTTGIMRTMGVPGLHDVTSIITETARGAVTHFTATPESLPVDLSDGCLHCGYSSRHLKNCPNNVSTVEGA